MKTVKGTIERIAQREKNYGLQINGEWYNGLGQAPVREGDKITLEYETVNVNGKEYKQIQSMNSWKSKQEKTEKNKSEKSVNEIIAREVAIIAKIRRQLKEVFSDEWDEKRFPELNSILNSIYIQVSRKNQ